jgi:hypothetical protein
MFCYATPSDDMKEKLKSLGYPEDTIFSYPEIAQWLGDAKKCILSPEMINTTDMILPDELDIMGIIYLGREQTIKCGQYRTVSDALKDMVEYVLREHYSWLSTTKAERASHGLT